MLARLHPSSRPMLQAAEVAPSCDRQSRKPDARAAAADLPALNLYVSFCDSSESECRPSGPPVACAGEGRGVGDAHNRHGHAEGWIGQEHAIGLPGRRRAGGGRARLPHRHGPAEVADQMVPPPRRQDALPVEAVSAGKLPDAVAALEKSKVTLVIIDTPATDTPAADAAMRAGGPLPHPRPADHLRHLGERDHARQAEDDGQGVRLYPQPMPGHAGEPTGHGRRRRAGEPGRPAAAADRLARRLPGSRPRGARHHGDRHGRQGGRGGPRALGLAQAPARQAEGEAATRAAGAPPDGQAQPPPSTVVTTSPPRPIVSFQ